MDLLLRDIILLAKGMGIGFAVAAPVGPIGMLCIRLTLEKGRLAGFCGGLGAAVADTIFAICGIIGITALSGLIEAQRQWFELGGGLFLIAFGVHLGLKQPISPSASGEVPQTLIADFGKTLALTLANPVTILSFMAVFAGVPGLVRLEIGLVPILIGGVLVGAAGWWLSLSLGVGFIRHMISRNALIWLNRIAGGLLVAFGFYTLAHVTAVYFWPV
ncbi:threonine/homoserine/homoserine lactone efflux protein [Dongia mobilis]|uniref:Threonine/homoserine/homoserine lactone efflux protein n=1 Tax=Dongia mobilis TaxID=578943 RepID=A0A4R6WFK8_9PROT|nr:LysE family transporter [Dongia mobilis]TDQ78849.1 threonine/homoserine/homoserine lactone efflux protein [Dongia mobilis]